MAKLVTAGILNVSRSTQLTQSIHTQKKMKMEKIRLEMKLLVHVQWKKD